VYLCHKIAKKSLSDSQIINCPKVFVCHTRSRSVFQRFDKTLIHPVLSYGLQCVYRGKVAMHGVVNEGGPDSNIKLLKYLSNIPPRYIGSRQRNFVF